MTAPIALDGDTLSLDDVLAVARDYAAVTLAPAAKAKVERCRAVVEKLLAGDVTVYGLNTGFGSLRDVHISPAQAHELQRNLIRSHACGVGDPAPVDVVRAMILLRANTLAKGFSGVRLLVIEQLLHMLNHRVHPIIPLKGSVGASGDLAPLSHLALVLIGEGEASVDTDAAFDRVRVSGAAALQLANLQPIQLEAKEGLALNNGTQFMTAIGALAFADAEYVTRLAVQACTLSIEALQGVHAAFDPRLHDARNHPGQRAVAAAMKAILDESQVDAAGVNFAVMRKVQAALTSATETLEHDASGSMTVERKSLIQHCRTLVVRMSADDLTADAWNPSKSDAACREIAALHASIFSLDDSHFHSARTAIHTALTEVVKIIPTAPPVQNDYSLRCAPQVLGASWDTLTHARRVLTDELNAATDNPLILPPPLPRPDCNLSEYRESLTVEDCRRAVLSGGNFHGAPIAIVLDHCCVALATAANISERRIFHITTGHLSNGLPRFLASDPGLQSGLMLAQVTAASLVSENKTLSHPASVDSIPTAEDAEDHVSMGAFAARKFAEVVRNVQYVIAIELMCAARGSRYRPRPLGPRE